MKLAVEAVRMDGGTQPRATIHQEWVEEYAQDMGDGAAFPPVVVFFDGTDYWLADGFHRTLAAKALGLVDIDVEVRQGTQRDAVLFSLSANATHGQRRTNEDKRRAVLVLLNDAEWSAKFSNNEIAKLCGVSHTMVNGIRKPPILKNIQDTEPMSSSISKPVVRTVTRGNSTYEIRTANIGRSRPAAPPRPTCTAPVAWTPADVVRNEPQPAPISEPIQPAPELVDPVSKPVAPFDWASANLKNKAMDAIKALADLPQPEAVIEAWNKFTGYGEPIGTLEKAQAWLTKFIPLYREAEPIRWARLQSALAATEESQDAA